MECKVIQVVRTGDSGGAGNLVICQVLLMHVKEEVLDAKGNGIDPFRLDAVARLGREWYCRVQGDSIFQVPRPNEKIPIGIDQLPHAIRNSKVLTGNDLGLLASVESIPYGTESSATQITSSEDAHRLAQKYLKEGSIAEAWRVLLSPGS
jgi:hypothetical protein